MEPARLAILGGNGMLGRELATVAAAAGWEVVVRDLPEWDIASEGDLAAVAAVPVIVNCAAYTNVDGAEADPQTCRRINAEAPGRLGRLARHRGAYVLHLSTDFVFGDDHGDRPQDESWPANPLNVYGAAKLVGEQALAASGCRHAIMRLQWTYGQHGRNFVSKVLQDACRLPKLRVVEDQVGAPTWTRDVARAILCLLRADATGLYHFAAAGFASRYEVARMVVAECGLDTPVVPCRSEEFTTPARRPRNSRFDCRKIEPLLDFTRPPWPVALRQYLRESSPGSP